MSHAGAREAAQEVGKEKAALDHPCTTVADITSCCVVDGAPSTLRCGVCHSAQIPRDKTALVTVPRVDRYYKFNFSRGLRKCYVTMTSERDSLVFVKQHSLYRGENFTLKEIEPLF